MTLADRLQALAARAAPLPVLRTARLVLRPFQERDRAPLAAMHADADVMRFLLGPIDAAASDALLDRLRVQAAREGLGVWAVELRESKTFLGFTGLAPVRFEAGFTPAVELVWRLAREAWGQGYATEAAQAAVGVGLGALALPRLVAFTAVDNQRSAAVALRLGMREEESFAHPKLPVEHPLSRHRLFVLDAAPAPAPAPAPAVEPVAPAGGTPAPAHRRPQVWLDGDGCPRAAKEITFRAVQRGVIACTIVANRPLVVPRHTHIRSVVVRHGLDVADEWLVAHAAPGDLVVTTDVPLAAELVARGVDVISSRGERFLPSNIGEKLSVRDFFTEARAAGLVEGGGPPAFDERARAAFANALDRWIAARRA